MKTRLLFVSAMFVVAGLLTLSGTASVAVGQDFREEFHQTHPLSASGRVSLENINGDVKIAVWDRNEVQISAVKTARREERLAEAKIEIQADADSISIKTRYPSRDNHWDADEQRRYNNPASVNYTLTVPRNARINKIDLINGALDIEGAAGEVRASLINGDLRASRLTGEVHLSTINGRLEAMFDQFNDDQRINLQSVNGSVIVNIPAGNGATLKATTVHGDIDNDFGLTVEKGKYVGRNLASVLGDGRARVTLNNVNGSIAIKR